MENEEKEVAKKGNIGLIIIVIVVFIISGVIGFYLGGKLADKEDKVVEKDNNSGNNQKDNEENKDKEEQKNYQTILSEMKKERKDQVIISYEDEEDGIDSYNVRLTQDGQVIANVKTTATDHEKTLNNEIIESNVVKYFVVNVGMRDVGDGRAIIFIKENGEISSIDVGYLVISAEVKVKRHDSLKNIVEFIQKEIPPANEYEPINYQVYAKDMDGKETNITDSILDD